MSGLGCVLPLRTHLLVHAAVLGVALCGGPPLTCSLECRVHNSRAFYVGTAKVLSAAVARLWWVALHMRSRGCPELLCRPQ